MKTDNAEIVSNYMLTEFEGLHQRASIQEQSIANKVNFFLVAVTAVIGGVFIVGGSNAETFFFLPFVSITSLFMLLVGVSTFVQILDLIANATFYYRRAGRIRRWFLDFDPSLVKYMPFVPSDEKPSFFPRKGFLRGMETVLVLLNAFLATSFVATIILVFQQQGMIKMYLAINYSLLFGFVVFIGAWGIQAFYFKHFLQRKDIDDAKNKYRVLYPSSETEKHHTNLLIKYTKKNE